MQREDEMKSALRAAGYRMTPQRLAICDILAASQEHPTPYAVYEEVRKAFPTVSLATVYNTLGALRDLGEIVEIGLGRSKTHYEPNLAPHANLICLQCGRIVDFDDLPMEQWSGQIGEASGFAVKNTRIDVFGICRRCQEGEEAHG